VQAAGIELHDGEFERRIVSRDAGAAAELPHNSGFVLLDTNVTPELAAEGMARDIVRAVQQARRDAGLAVSDRIRLTIDGREDALAAAREHEALIAGETLALEVRYEAVSNGVACKVGDGSEVRVSVEKK
jgi:isoleucyl-tRNA synthetase